MTRWCFDNVSQIRNKKLKKVRETHLKQLQYISDTRNELEQQINAISAKYSVLKKVIVQDAKQLLIDIYLEKNSL